MSKKSNKSDFIDIKGTLATYARRWYWFLLSLIICGAAAYVYVKMNPRKSRVCASILVTQDDGAASMLNGLGGLFGADPYVQDEIFVITSHTVLKDVVKQLGINKLHEVKTGLLTKKFEYPTWPVDVVCDSAITDTLMANLNFKVEVRPGGETADITVKHKSKKIKELTSASLPAEVQTIFGNFTVVVTDSIAGAQGVTSWISVTGYDTAAEDLAEEIEAEIASKKSNVIELAIETTNPDYGRDVLNNIMAVYNAQGIKERNLRATKTARFIDERLAIISKDLADAESDIEKYKEGKNLVDVHTEAVINTQLKTEYESKLVTLTTEKDILELSLNFLEDTKNKYELMPITSFGESETAAATIEKYNELILKRMELVAGANEGNRLVQEIELQIDAMRENILVALRQAIKSSNVAINEAKKQAEMAMAKLGNVPTQEREYINLKRQQEVKQQLYLFLLQRSEETAMLIANAIPKGQIIDAAYVLSKPVGPSPAVIMIIAILVAFLLPLPIFYICQSLRTKMNGRTDIEKITGLPVIGEMCIDKSRSKLVVSETTTTSSAELFRMLRANLQFVLSGREDKVVMITSSKSGEGKSFISTNLAASLALLGKKVVIIGMDIRKPQLANYLGISPTPGLTQYLSDADMTISDVLRSYSEIPGMDIIVAGPIPPNPGELMTSPRIAEMMDELRKQYDYIVLDTAPVGMVSDAFNLTRYSDATIYVVYDKRTRLQDLRFLNDIAEDERLKRVNVVINGTKSKKGYGYGYK